MELFNTTHLNTARLNATFRRFAHPWPLEGLTTLVRYTRSAPFSGLCQYSTGRLSVNIGRRNRYPFELKTYIAKAQTRVLGPYRTWSRPLYVVPLRDAYELALFLFLHELYHWLVRRARRNIRQKESRCDRFAVRALVDGLGAVVLDAHGVPVPRQAWDFQDLDGFVARARAPTRRRKPARVMAPPPRPLVHTPSLAAAGLPNRAACEPGRQLVLFDV